MREVTCPAHASAWKGSQMSFRMASATPLEIQVERNRCWVILIFLILCFFISCYLTTVIPYEKKNGPPSVEDLQILTKILRAMKEDSEKVPSLLTDYILKVLCPT